MSTAEAAVRPPAVPPAETRRRGGGRIGAAVVATGIAIAVVAVTSVPALRFGDRHGVGLLALTVSAWVCALPVHAAAVGRRDPTSVLRSLGVLIPWGWSAYAVLTGRPDAHLAAAAIATALIVLVGLTRQEGDPRGEDVPGWYAVLVPATAAAAAVAWWLTGDPSAGAGAALATLLVGTPAAPALTEAATRIALRRRGAALGCAVADNTTARAVARIDTLVLDKDGTVTTGQLRVTSVEPVEPDHDRDLRWFAGALEHASEHPIGRAIAKLSTTGVLADVRHHPGRGLSGSVDRHPVRVGDPTWLGMSPTHGIGTTVGVEVDGRPLGRITVWDDVRDHARGALVALHELGIETVLVSAADDEATRHLATLVSPTSAYGGLGAEGRLARVESLRGSGRRVAFAGPAVDEPARDAAELAVGTDLAADVVVDDLDVGRLPGLLVLCRSAARRALLARRVAVAGTVVGLVLAASGLLSPLGAAVAAAGICAVSATTAATV